MEYKRLQQLAFTAKGTQVPYDWITQCHLPPSTGDIPAFTYKPIKADTQFRYPGGMQAELT